MAIHRHLVSVCILALAVTSTSAAGAVGHKYLQKSGANISKARAKVFANGVWAGRNKAKITIGLPPENTLAGKFLAKVEAQVRSKKRQQPHVKRITLSMDQLLAAGEAFAAYERHLEKRHGFNLSTYFDATSDMERKSANAMSIVRFQGKNVRGINTYLDLRDMVSKELDQVAKKLVKSF